MNKMIIALAAASLSTTAFAQADVAGGTAAVNGGAGLAMTTGIVAGTAIVAGAAIITTNANSKLPKIPGQEPILVCQGTDPLSDGVCIGTTTTVTVSGTTTVTVPVTFTYMPTSV